MDLKDSSPPFETFRSAGSRIGICLAHLAAWWRLLFVRFGFVLVALRFLWVPFRFLVVAFRASDVPECRMFVISAQATIRDATRTGSNTSSKLGKAKTNKGEYQAKGLGPRRASGKEGIVLPCHATEP